MKSFKQKAKLSLLASVVAVSACVDDSTDPSSNAVSVDSFDFVAMFKNYADNIIIPNYQALADKAGIMAQSDGPIANYCDAIGNPSEAEALTAAEEAWNNTQAAIAISESHIIGPAKDNDELLRNRLNSYHAGELSTCGIDQAVMLADQDSNFDVVARTVTQRGIGAVEYLLFNTDLTHTCPSQVTETVNWNARSEVQRKRLRCEYAVVISNDIATNANQLVNSWSSDGDNYRNTFINPANISDTLSALSDAMFFMDVEIKDIKLGIPTGINSDCSAISCPDKVESPYLRTSFAHIRNNLEAFKTMLTGADGPGFDDIITQAGVSELNTELQANITAAIENIDSQTNSLFAEAAAISNAQDEADCNNAFTNPETTSDFPACNLYGLIKLITDDLKVDFVAAVEVDLPNRAQSDND